MSGRWKILKPFFTFYGPCNVICLRNKDQQDPLFFLKLFQYSILYMAYAAHGIYPASTLTSC